MFLRVPCPRICGVGDYDDCKACAALERRRGWYCVGQICKRPCCGADFPHATTTGAVLSPSPSVTASPCQARRRAGGPRGGGREGGRIRRRCGAGRQGAAHAAADAAQPGLPRVPPRRLLPGRHVAGERRARARPPAGMSRGAAQAKHHSTNTLLPYPHHHRGGGIGRLLPPCHSLPRTRARRPAPRRAALSACRASAGPGARHTRRKPRLPRPPIPQAAANLTFTPNPWSLAGSSPGGASVAGAADFSRFAAAGPASPALLGAFSGGGCSSLSPPLAQRIGRVRGWAVQGGADAAGGGCGLVLGVGDDSCGVAGLPDVLRV